MGRVKSSSFKIGAIVLCFFLLLAGAFIGMLIYVRVSVTQVDTGKNPVYILTQTDYKSMMESNGALVFRSEQSIQESVYRRQALQTVYAQLFPLALAFLGVLSLLSFALLIFLRGCREHEMHQIAEQLNAIMDRNAFMEHGALSAAYETLRHTLESHLNDYKRLNSYLSHEQKNALAILRTDLELSGHTDCLSLIDDMTDGINDILTLSENPNDAAPSAVDVALVCAEVCDHYRSLSDQITFDFNVDDGTEIVGRQRWIYRAVANLVDNAIKYGNSKPIRLSVYTKKGSVIVRVEDHGIGISPEKQEEIFSHCYRIDELNKDGYGIGLSLVSHVCNLCGGFVTVESEVGKGSIFYLSFPQRLF